MREGRGSLRKGQYSSIEGRNPNSGYGWMLKPIAIRTEVGFLPAGGCVNHGANNDGLTESQLSSCLHQHLCRLDVLFPLRWLVLLFRRRQSSMRLSIPLWKGLSRGESRRLGSNSTSWSLIWQARRSGVTACYSRSSSACRISIDESG